MCENDFLMCDVPKDAIENAINAWSDFKRAPSDYDKFRALDWLINVAAVKWQSYSDTRKASGA
jgi:hypothetical protein